MSETTVERDLRFFPAPTDRPGAFLSPEQIATYNRDGCLPCLDFCSPSEVVRNREVFDALLAAYQAKGIDSYWVNNCHKTCGSLYDLCRHPRITAAVGDILGDAFALWSTHYFCKMPHDGKTVTWHQDAPYWPFTPSKTVTVWLAIDDSDEENGAMRVIPGSHLVGALPMRKSTPEENNVLWFTVDDVERHGTPRPLILKAGQASLHSDMILHGSPANPSDRRRCGLTLRYCSLDVHNDQGWNDHSIIIKGSDPSGHWGKVTSRPPRDEAFVTDGPAIGSN